jgi:hypothetical protein
MYVAKSEAQSFADTAALNAAVQLALKPGSFSDAGQAAANTAKRGEFGGKPFNVVTEFGTGPADTFTATPPGAGHNASDYTFTQVTARLNLPLYILPVIVGSTTSSIAASAVAGQATTPALPGGEFPFSPVSRKSRPDCPSDPFGYCVGQQYTLRWPPPGHAKGTVCHSDQWTDRGNWGTQWRGYCCVSGNGVPSLERAIMLGQGTVPLGIGDSVPTPPGQKEAIDINTYIGYDNDTDSSTYAQYYANGTGNGKRVITVPINDPDTQKVVGFAAFFLPSSEGKFEVCAEYIGSMVEGLPGLPPGSGSGFWHLRLYQ